jgi:serpin B
MTRIGGLKVAVVTFIWASLLWPGASAHADAVAIEELVDRHTSFALDLYNQVRNEKKNLFFSPHSISTALAMTYAGARGRTAEQIADALHFPSEQEELHDTFGRLEAQMHDIRGKGDLELRTANAVWAQKTHSFLAEFLDVVTNNYQAELRSVDFTTDAEAARREINRWVERETNTRIKDLMGSGTIDHLTRLVLISAVYFKGLWAAPFDKGETKTAPFWTAPGNPIDLSMMTQEHEFSYAEEDDLQALELPYAGHDLSMIVLLPREIDGLGQLETSLSQKNFDRWLARFKKQRVQVYLPRLIITSRFGLEKALASMGMPDAFAPGVADFSGIDGTRRLFLSAVVHKAFVDVNETGTEAAGATGVSIGVTSVPARLPVFRADHPFFFVIRENRSGSLLFLGRLVSPTR